VLTLRAARYRRARCHIVAKRERARVARHRRREAASRQVDYYE